MDFVVTEAQRQRAELQWLLDKASELHNQAQENAAELQEISRQIEALQQQSATPSQPAPLTDP